MRNEIDTQIEIEAPIEVVWSVLLDNEKYKTWNPFIVDFVGDLALGNKIEVTIAPPNQKAMTFKPVIQKFEKYQLVWKGKLFLPSLFDGTHQFYLKRISDKKCLFVHKEDFYGLLVSFFRKLISIDSKKGFEEMNNALKNESEKLWNQQK